MTWDDMRGDTFDSRDIIDRIEELEDTLETVTGTEAHEAADELAILEAVQADGMSAADWSYGETFIPESSFEDYAQQLAEDIGAVSPDASWPLRHIDWTAAAAELQQDYTSYTFDGIDYLARS